MFWIYLNIYEPISIEDLPLSKNVPNDKAGNTRKSKEISPKRYQARFQEESMDNTEVIYYN